MVAQRDSSSINPSPVSDSPAPIGRFERWVIPPGTGLQPEPRVTYPGMIEPPQVSGIDRDTPPPRGVWGFTKRLFTQFVADEPFLLGSSLSFYTALSLAPLIVVVLTIASAIWGQQAASGQLVSQMEQVVGRQGAELAQTIIAQAGQSQQTGWAAILGAAALLFGATGVFVQLQSALNKIWDVKSKPGNGLRLFIRNRLLSLGMVLSLGFLLLVSLVASAAIHFMADSVRGSLPGGAVVWQVVTVAASIALFTLFFAALFKFLPDVKIEWRTVWMGAAVTALLFVAGKQLLALYLGRGTVGSAYGAAGSLFVLLLWVYYSSLILFFGAEFTQVYAARTGHRIDPDRYAVRESQS